MDDELNQDQSKGGSAKPCRFQPHARLRQRQRNITDGQIEEVIRMPDEILPCIDKKRVRARKTIGERMIDVIYEERKNYYLIVTCIEKKKRRT